MSGIEEIVHESKVFQSNNADAKNKKVATKAELAGVRKYTHD